MGLFLIIPVLNYENEMTDIIVFGLGKADSILIKNKSQTILIDSGRKRDKKVLADKLRTLGIKKIDYMILTHPDKDHIGGASYLIDNFTVDTIIQGSYIKNSKDEARLKNSLAQKEIRELVLEDDYYFDMGDLKIDLILPKSDEFEKSNDHSISVLVKDREMNYFFAGDAEKRLLAELIERELPEIDLYKVAHHGRLNSNSKEFIHKISPYYSVITNSIEASEVSQILEDAGSEIHFAFDKDVYFYSDGKKLIVR